MGRHDEADSIALPVLKVTVQPFPVQEEGIIRIRSNPPAIVVYRNKLSGRIAVLRADESILPAAVIHPVIRFSPGSILRITGRACSVSRLKATRSTQH